MSGHVFVSYSRQDKLYVKLLIGHMRAAGIDVWIDESLEPGTPTWVREIERAIDECVALVPVMTTSSAESAWVDREIDLAQELGKPILPLLADGRRFMRLRDVQAEDVTGGRLPSAAYLGTLAKFAADGPLPRTARPKATPVTAPLSSPSPTPIRILSGSAPGSKSIAWSPDGTMIAAAGPATRGYLWDVESATITEVVTDCKKTAGVISWSPDGQSVAMSGDVKWTYVRNIRDQGVQPDHRLRCGDRLVTRRAPYRDRRSRWAERAFVDRRFTSTVTQPEDGVHVDQ